VSTAAASTRERLLSSALALVDSGGYGAATVSAMAARAGVATGTLYRHFPSKESLFVELFRAVCDREYAAMRAAADASADAGALTQLTTVLETFARRALRRPRRAWALIAEPVDPLVDAERLAYRSRYAALVEEFVRAGVVAGDLPEQDPRFTAAALIGGCAEALVGPLAPARGERRPEADAVLQAQRTFVARAIGADDAR
jgi:AcrR family transcriptional regulator